MSVFHLSKSVCNFSFNLLFPNVSFFYGQIYSAKVPEDWGVDESISGINIANPEDSNMGVALSAIITNPSKVGGADKVRHISAKDLANDSSPLMDAWNYRNGVEDRTSHNFSDATMGVESDLVSPSTGQSYTLPLSSYDPTEGGYHNPNNYSEILEDLYK